jgi:drug/metabolite transporter (DMT)-like permease
MYRPRPRVKTGGGPPRYYLGMPRQTGGAAAYGLATAFIWGLSFLSIKTAVAAIPPMTLAVARFVVACSVLPLLALASRESLRIPRKDLLPVACSGLVGITLYFLGENNGVARLPASESSLIIGTIPVLTMLAERAFAGTRLAVRSYAGAFLSLVGVALIVARSEGAASSPLGYVFMGVAAVSWVAYNFIVKRVSKDCGRVALTFWQSLFGLAGCVPFALAERASWKVPSFSVSLNVIYLGVLCSAAGYWLYTLTLDRVGPGRAAAYINLIPVISVVAAYALLGERLGPLQLAGGAVAVAGVYLATTPERRRSGPGASPST